MSRTVPFDREAICDICGMQGAFDFMGDLLCTLCMPEEDAVLEECDPELDVDLDDLSDYTDEDESFGPEDL